MPRTVAAVVLVAAVAGSAWLVRAWSAARAGSLEAVWVFFDEAASDPAASPAFGPEAAARRAMLGIGPLDNDRPLDLDRIERVRATGAHVREVSRWLRAVSVDADRATITRLQTLPGVVGVRPVGRMVRAGGESVPRVATVTSAPPAAGTVPVAQTFDSTFYGPNWPALRELNIAPVHLLGFIGTDVRVALLDTGFEPRHTNLVTRQVIGSRDFINGDTVVYDQPGDLGGPNQARHGTRVWSILGGHTPGTVVGPAYGARFLLAKVDAEPGDTGADEDRWVAALEWADSAGARVVNSSLVYRFSFIDRPAYTYSQMNGDVTPTTRAADEAARRGILVVNAIGNFGPGTGTLEAPADADSIIAVGALNAQGQPASFTQGATARGPTFDMRTKPELAARGVGLWAASSEDLTTIVTSLSGTSFATPLIAGAAAAFVQAWPNLTPFAIRRAFMLAGSNAAAPNNAIGSGTPDVASAILFPQGLAATGLATTDQAGNLTTIAPTFTWSAPLVHPQMRPVTYRVEIATDSLFQNVVRADTTREAFSLTLTRAIRPADRLWWRVVARTPLGVGRTSAPATRFGVPPWVRLVSPAGSVVTFIEDPRPLMSWAALVAPPPVGPLVFDVEVIANSNGQVVQRMQGVSGGSVRVPQPLNYNVSYRWRVIARSQGGVADTVDSAAPFVVTSTGQPPATLLYQNFPNPFPRPDLDAMSTTIWFDLAERSDVELSIHDMSGRIVRTLIPAPGCGRVTLDPGLYGRGGIADSCVITSWDGGDASGVRVGAGVYIIRLRAAGDVQFRRLLFQPR